MRNRFPRSHRLGASLALALIFSATDVRLTA
ncbi:MAG: hypothetical protein V7632_653 [Bradyrhizobium sp.]|jgi:hypothetical protein